MKTLNTKKKDKLELETTGTLTFDSTTWDGNIYVYEGGCNSITFDGCTIECTGPEHSDCPKCQQPMDYMLITRPGAIQETWNGCESCGYRVKL